MRPLSGLRASLIALIALVGAGASTAAHADSGTIRISVIKAGWLIGASGGNGVLDFRGRRYPLSIGGLSYGLTFGASQTNLVGHRDQYPPPVGCRRRLRRGGRGPCDRRWRAGDRAAQREGRDAHPVGPPGRPDRERRLERAGDRAALVFAMFRSMPGPCARAFLFCHRAAPSRSIAVMMSRTTALIRPQGG